MSSKQFILILGGARSGKSDFALKMAKELGGPVLFVATAEAKDAEMRQRIEEHRRHRPKEWRTLEAPLDVSKQIVAHMEDASVVVIDCLTMWAANVLSASSPMDQDEPDLSDAKDALADDLGGLHDWYRYSKASLIVVSNEVGMGLVPPYPSGRAFRDLLGWANQFVATRATLAYFLIAGIPVELKSLAVTPWSQDIPL
ncbi:MAG: bifunctional adenosylcobinamide kinase/adenosylcobinamide-phosphate guanylyltransferase [Dehalococcoidia bacterium]|nr:bifunctional adenosylcobinamide kinase/adenosylcobinamide-phosphate guanylyltransferase [Dehalococcoidia bacterium]